MSGTLRLTVLVLAVTAVAAQFRPVAYVLPNPPPLLSALSPNFALYNAEKVHNNKLKSPSSIAIVNGNVYTISNGLLVNSSPCRPKAVANLKLKGCRSVKQCGMITSIRPDRLVPGAVLVLDAYRGVFRVDTNNGRIQQLMANDRPIGGRVPVFLNDFVQARDGTILISDSSDKFSAVNDIYILVEGRPGGRILSLNGTSGVTAEVLNEVFVYPSGLELTADETGLLVAESGRARILRIGLTSADWMKVTTFSVNMPGLPSNIRRSDRGTYWVGLFYIRHRGAPSVMDTYSKNPGARLWSMNNVRPATMRSYFRKYGMVVELNSQGKIIGSLHDPTGRVVAGVSEAQEYDGLLYFVDKDRSKNFIGRIVLPQGDGRVITVNSAIQVLRSRCQIRENQLSQARKVLTQYINKRTNTSNSNSQVTRASNQPNLAGLVQQGSKGLLQAMRQTQALQQSPAAQPQVSQPQYSATGFRQPGVNGLTAGVTQQAGLTPAQTGLSTQVAALSQATPGLGAQMAALSKAQMGVLNPPGLTVPMTGLNQVSTGVQGQIGAINQANAGAQAQPSIAEQIAALKAKQAAQQAQHSQQLAQLQLAQQTQLGQQSQQTYLTQLTPAQQALQTLQQAQQQAQPTQHSHQTYLQQLTPAQQALHTPQTLQAHQQAQQQAQQALHTGQTLQAHQQAQQQAQPTQQSQQALLAQQMLQVQQAQKALQAQHAAYQTQLRQQTNSVGQTQSQPNLGSLLNQPRAAVQAQSLATKIASATQQNLASQAQPNSVAAQLAALNQAQLSQSSVANQIMALNQANAAQLAALNKPQPVLPGLADQIAALQQQQQQAQAHAGLSSQLASLGQSAASSHTNGQALYQKLSGAATATNPQPAFTG